MWACQVLFVTSLYCWNCSCHRQEEIQTLPFVGPPTWESHTLHCTVNKNWKHCFPPNCAKFLGKKKHFLGAVPGLETLFWHSLRHTIWECIRHFCSDIRSDILSGTYFHILSGILSHIFSGKYSDFLSGIFSSRFNHSFWQSFWHSLTLFLTFYMASILTAFLSDILPGVWLKSGSTHWDLTLGWGRGGREEKRRWESLW